MTRVYFEHDDGTFGIHARGHATGEDSAVCAAVSVLMCTLAGFIKQHPDDGGIYRLKSADSSVVFFDRGEASRAVYDLARVGFHQLAASYPDYVRIEEDAE